MKASANYFVGAHLKLYINSFNRRMAGHFKDKACLSGWMIQYDGFNRASAFKAISDVFPCRIIGKILLRGPRIPKSSWLPSGRRIGREQGHPSSP